MEPTEITVDDTVKAVDVVVPQKPSKGRMVRLFMYGAEGEVLEECAAVIAHVWEENDIINVCGFRTNGNASAFTSIPRDGNVATKTNITTWEFPSF